MSQALVDEIYCDLVEDACLGLSFEVHRAVKQGHFFLDDTDQESMKEFGGYHSFFLILTSSKPLKGCNVCNQENNARRKIRPLNCRNVLECPVVEWANLLTLQNSSSSPVGAKLGRKQHKVLCQHRCEPACHCDTDASPLVFFLRNCGPAGGGRIRSGVQPVEEQGV